MRNYWLEKIEEKKQEPLWKGFFNEISMLQKRNEEEIIKEIDLEIFSMLESCMFQEC